MIVEWRRVSGSLTRFQLRIRRESADRWCFDKLRDQTASVQAFVDPF